MQVKPKILFKGILSSNLACETLGTELVFSENHLNLASQTHVSQTTDMT